MTEVTLTNKTLNLSAAARIAKVGDAVDRLHFTLPKEYDGRDLTIAHWKLVYQLPDSSGAMPDLDITVTETAIEATYELKGAIVSKAGKVDILLTAVDAENEIVYQSDVASITVAKTLIPSNLAPEVTLWQEYLILYDARLAGAQSAEAAAKAYALISATKATEASGSATTAGTHAGTATTKAAEAGQSATTAQNAATTATTKAQEAGASATLAGEKATEASGSATTAGTHAGTATTKAAEALASQQIATTKAAEALASAESVAASAAMIGDHEIRIARIEGRVPKIYGFKKHKSTGVITALYDSVALGPVPVIEGTRSVGFVNPYAAINIFHWRSCLMNTKQQILAFHGQPGYTTPGATDSYEVQVPMAYVDVWEDDTYSYKVMSEQQAMEGMFVPGCFRDPDGNLMPYAYVDKYRRGTIGAVSVSRPDVLPDVSQTMLQFETKAEAIDATMLWTGCPEELDWYITLVSQIMALSIDTQAYYGQGMSAMPYSASHVVTAVTAAANTVVVSNATAAAFKVSMNVKLGSALGSGQTFDDRTIQTITDNGDGSSTIVVDGNPFTTIVGYILHAHRQVTTSYEATEIGEDCGFILHDGRSESQVENWFNGIAGQGGDVYEFSFGILRYDNQPYICHDRRQLKHNDDPRLNAAYRPCGYIYETASDLQWIKNMKLVGDKPYCIEWVSEGGAGSTTHYADPVYYLTASYRGTRIVRRRFSWFDGSSCGRVGLSGYYVLSSAYWAFGWRSSPSKLIK